MRSFTAAMDYLNLEEVAATVNQVFVIGGAGVYAEAMTSPQCTKLYVTTVLKVRRAHRAVLIGNIISTRRQFATERNKQHAK